MSTATVPAANGKPAPKTAQTSMPTVAVQAPKAGTRAPAETSVPVFDYSRLREAAGSEYLRGYECGQLLHVVTAAFREAETCANRADRAATEAEVREALVEALTCTATAEHYARMLLDQLKWPDPRLGPAF